MEETHGLVALSNHIAKTAELAQVCNLTALPARDLDDVLASTLVEEVRGVGRKIGSQLHQCGVDTVLDLARLDPAMVRRRWSARYASFRACSALSWMTRLSPRERLPAPGHSARP